jgi:hypothetical protein
MKILRLVPPIPEGFQQIARGREAHPGFTWETETTLEGLKHPSAPHLSRGSKVDVSPPTIRNRPTNPVPNSWLQARRAERQ